MIIAGVSGDGADTARLWQEFTEKEQQIAQDDRIDGCGYEVRVYCDQGCFCHVGVAVRSEEAAGALATFSLQPCQYAVFEVRVCEGYDSQNAAMDRWLKEHKEGYVQARYQGNLYAVEAYGEKFNGDEPDSIVEIWVPVERL